MHWINWWNFRCADYSFSSCHCSVSLSWLKCSFSLFIFWKGIVWFNYWLLIHRWCGNICLHFISISFDIIIEMQRIIYYLVFWWNWPVYSDVKRTVGISLGTWSLLCIDLFATTSLWTFQIWIEWSHSFLRSILIFNLHLHFRLCNHLVKFLLLFE